VNYIFIDRASSKQQHLPKHVGGVNLEQKHRTAKIKRHLETKHLKLIAKKGKKFSLCIPRRQEVQLASLLTTESNGQEKSASCTSKSLYSGERSTGTIDQAAEWTSEGFLTFGEEKNLFLLPEINP
jgi:hypothetical protein